MRGVGRESPKISSETVVALEITALCSRPVPSCEDRDIGNTVVVLGQRWCGAVHGPLVNVGTWVGVVCCYPFRVVGISSAWWPIQTGNKPRLRALKGGNVKAWQQSQSTYRPGEPPFGIRLAVLSI
jgi:hypothetical protein